MFNALTNIRGPGFDKAERVTFDISGNQVSFLAPGYNYHMVAQEEDANAQHYFDVSNPATYKVSTEEREDDRPFDPTKEVDGFPLFNSMWHFSKPILDTSPKERRTVNSGSMSLSCFVSRLFNFDSLFVPSNFEKAVLFDIEYSFGPESYFGGPGSGGRRFIGPLKWQPQTFNGVTWIRYFIEWNGSPNCGKFIWVAPLTNEHTVSFSFSNAGRPSSKLLAAFENFMEKLVSSCTIEHSDEVKAQIAAVADEAAVSRISEQVEPFAWEEYDLDPEKFEFESLKEVR